MLEVAAALAETHPHEVLVAGRDWCDSAVRLSASHDGARLARAGLWLLLELLPVGSVRELLEVIDDLACRGGERIRAAALQAARELAVGHRREVLGAALFWAGNIDGRPYEEAVRRASLATGLFLDLAAWRDAAGLAVTLTGPGAVDPAACVMAWRVATAAEAGMSAGPDGYSAAAALWLDTAVARPDLRAGIVSMFAAAAGGDPALRMLVADRVRAWAGFRRDRRDVRDDVLVRVLQPEWKRLLLVGWVWLRRAAAARR